MIEFEEKLELEYIKSKKVAWTFATFFAFIALALAIAIALMLPLKSTAIKVLAVDKNTGYPLEVTSLAKGSVARLTTSESVHKFFAQQYIILHDSYDIFSVRDAFVKVQQFSTDSVFEDYRKKFFPPIDIEKNFGDSKILEVQVISLSPQSVTTPFNDTSDGVTMQARIRKIIREGTNILSEKTGMVTMTFGYDTAIEMDEKARNVNPLGFTVTSYRFDPDQ